MVKRIPFPTTAEQKQKLNKFIIKMEKSNVGNIKFIRELYKFASIDQGIYDLVELWINAPDENERNECLKDLEGIINDHKKM